MFRIILLAAILVASNASQYCPVQLGPWGLKNQIVNMGALRKKDDNIKEVKTTSRKASSGTNKQVEAVKSAFDQELEQELEEAASFFHAVESAENAVIHAIDDEVETIFPHRKRSKEE
mmetsp:Transcript_9507/g.21452  ORF Transcript_9507/g.21452 Transcript_9507/m.21452 type:complete len:118 (-) Transcript_9507:125-478(-)